MAVELSQPPKRKNISRSEILSEGKKEKSKELNEYCPLEFSKQNRWSMTSCQRKSILKLQSSMQNSGGHLIISRRYSKGVRQTCNYFPPHFPRGMKNKQNKHEQKMMNLLSLIPMYRFVSKGDDVIRSKV